MADRFVIELQSTDEELRQRFSDRSDNYYFVDGSQFLTFSKFKEHWSWLCPPEMLVLKYVDEEDDVIPMETEEEFKEFFKFVKQRSTRGMTVKMILNTKSSIDQQNTWKSTLKEELKQEIIQEIKSELGATGFDHNEPISALSSEDDEDMYYCRVNDIRREKVLNMYKKLEKLKERSEGKLDYHLEKLELKKKKLLEKESRKVNRKILPALTQLYDLALVENGFTQTRGEKFSMPQIMSGIVTKESSTVTETKEVGETFEHVWQIINDGTVPWKNNVQLRHKWSSPGLIPEVTYIECSTLRAGEEKPIAVRFRAPETVGPFISYWDFYYKSNTTWQQFGHYVSLNGSTKVSFKTLQKSIIKDAMKKSKKEKKTVTIKESVRKDPTESKSNQETAIYLNEELKSTIKKHLEVSLASSEIAAEMSREAANAARRAFGREQSATSSNQLSEAAQDLLKTFSNCQEFSFSKEEKNKKITDAQDVAQEENQPKTDASNNEPVMRPVVEQPNQPLSFPSLDPNMNYPVFPCPPPAYVPSTTSTQFSPFFNKQTSFPQSMPFPNPATGAVFPPPLSNGSVFPPPASGIVFPPPPPVVGINYGSQFPPHPTYPPPPVTTPGWTPPGLNPPPYGDSSPTDPSVNTRVLIDQMMYPPATSADSPLSGAEGTPVQTTSTTQTASDAVQILPPGLVDGAINVASTAYTSVVGALNKIRTKDDKDCPEFDPVFENNLAQLIEMGFLNVARNARLLKRNNNNIATVIDIICSGGVDITDID